MTRKQKRNLIRIIASAVLLAAAYVLDSRIEINSVWLRLAVYFVPYIIVGYDVLIKSLRNILRGDFFDEDFLMSIATVGAFFTSEYAEAVFVMLFFQVGELFQSLAVGKSRRQITALMDIRPDSACVSRDGEEFIVDPDEVEIGEIIVIRPGEKIAIDGIIVEGKTTVDSSALTGESIPLSLGVGDRVVSGSICVSGLIRVRTEKAFGESTVAKILDLVENASSEKSKTENFISRFAKVYTPSVVIAAVFLAVVPSLITGDWGVWVHRALTFLVISCPCALVISVPLAYFAGIGGASSRGILVKGSNYLEALAKTKTVVFDKTGTLTKGVFKVTEVAPVGITEEELVFLAATAEAYSTHPIALSLRESCASSDKPDAVEEISGEGIVSKYKDMEIAVGNARLMKRFGIDALACDSVRTTVFVAVGGEYKGMIAISDEIKHDSASAVKGLGGISVKTVMLTGDRKNVADRVGAELGVDEVYSELLPADKVDHIKRIIESSSGKTAFVGDGINDAPVLMRSDVGIAMGALGSDAAIEAADVVITDDSPSKILTAIAIAKKTNNIVIQNIVFAISVKLGVLILSALGLVPMAAAVFADVGVAVIAIINSVRAMKTK